MKNLSTKRNMLTVLCCVLLLAALVFVVHTSAASRLFFKKMPVPAAEKTDAALALARSASEPAQTPAESSAEPSSSSPAAQPETTAAQPSCAQDVESALQEPESAPPTQVPAPILPEEPVLTEAPAQSASEPSAPETEPETALAGPLEFGAAQAPVNAAGQTVSALPTGDYTGRLAAAADTLSYTFAVPNRGALHYALTPVNAQSGEWQAVLYQEYYVNGNGGETALRELNVLNASAENGKAQAPGMGLLPGKYVVRVGSGSTFSTAQFKLDLHFVSGTEYEIEYNNAVTRYTEIWPNIPVKGSASLYGSGRDEDWFMLRTYTDCAIDLLFTHAVNDQITAAFKIYLYDEGLNEIYAGVSAQNAASCSSGRIGLPAGTYFVLVQARVYMNCEYTLTPRRVNDTYEKERNDTPETATPVFSGQLMNGALSARTGKADRDYFTFTAQEPGYAEIYLKNLTSPEKSEGYIRRITLTDAAANPVWSALITDKAVKIVSPNVGLAPGRYYLLVDNDSLHQSDAPYEIGFTFTATGGWEQEYNGAAAYANALTQNVPVSGTLTDVGADFDEDWFTFTAEAAGRVQVTLTHEDTGGSSDIFNVTLFNAAGEKQGEVLVSRLNTPAVTGSFTVSPGVYYCKVTSGNYKTDLRYYLTYSFEK